MALTDPDNLSDLKRIRGNIEDAAKYMLDNNRNFHKFREFLYRSNLTSDERQMLAGIDKPDVQFNICEAYVSRLKGEFSKQEPSPIVKAVNDNVTPLLVDVIQGHLRYIFEEASHDKMETKIYDDTLSGGFSGMEVWTEYANDRSMEQVIKIGKAFDPTLWVWDPLARKLHKGDGRFCAKIYPMTAEKLKKEWPNVDISSINFGRSISDEFNWYYQSNNTKVFMIAEYYEKVEEKKWLYYLSNHKTMLQSDYNKLIESWDRIEQPPQIVKKRKTSKYDVMRYHILGDILLDGPEKTDFESLPQVFVDGNSEFLKENSQGMTQQFCRPYFYNAIDTQRLMNFAGQTFASEIANLVSAKFMVDERAIPEKYLEFWQAPQKVSTLVYRSIDKEGRPIPEPRDVPRSPMPQEVYLAFESGPKTIQNILGSYDAAVGKNEKEMSGIALIESATQSNATAMPYVDNFLISLNQVAKIIVELIPKYYITPMSLPIIDSDGNKTYIKINQPVQDMPTLMMDYSHTDLEVSVEVALNFKVQKNRDLTMMATLAQAFPEFAQFINEKGLAFILDNLDMSRIDELKQMAKDWTRERDQMRQQAQQAGSQNPELQQQQQDLALRKQKQDQEYQIKIMQLQQQEKENEIKRIQLIVDAQQSVAGHNVQLTKAQTEREAKAAELAMKEVELAAKHDQMQRSKENERQN